MSTAPKRHWGNELPHSGKFRSRPPAPALPSYETFCSQGLRDLVRALGTTARDYDDLVRVLMQGWGDRPIPHDAPFPSQIGDDHSPFEYSLAFDPSGVELRLLLEAQGTPADPQRNLRAALDLNERLSDHFGIDRQRFDAVKDLFLAQAVSPFTLWHAVCLTPNGQPSFKVYLNPQARGAESALALIDEVLLRLGFGDVERGSVRAALPRRGVDELGYFSLDLSAEPDARVKVYVAHPHISPAELDRVFETCPGHRVGDVVDFCNSMSGGRTRFDRKPLMSCLSFVSGTEGPKTVTLHLPIAHYVDNDEQTFRRVRRFLDREGLDSHAYEQAMAAVARRPLDEGAGIQSYASFRREGGAMRFTAYLSPELFRQP